jgi:para-aminobenzoate synthetase component 1
MSSFPILAPLVEPATPLVEELTPTPSAWDVCVRLARLPRLLFLDSADTGGALGRYSFITADPFAWLRSRGRDIWENGSRLDDTDPFAVLAERLACWPSTALPGLPPFQGGAAGLFGYDLCHHLERLPRPRFDEFEIPDLAVGFYDWVVAFDHHERRAWLISTGLPETEPLWQQRRAEERLRAVRTLLQGGPSRVESQIGKPAPAVVPARSFPVSRMHWVSSNFDRDSYLAMVRRGIDYIHAGDCYQVNLAQRLLHPATQPPLELYQRLRARNPSPFAGYFDLGDFTIVSASPERFVRVEHGEVETRPIKGTRPRGATPDEDRARADELEASAKDRAENIMIVDLLRNDLGRVCEYGTMRVPAVCRLESFRYVHHLVSEVRGRLKPGLTAVDLLRAGFPGGSVTGAPKIRAMEIISELEQTARGPYCGCLGYLGFDGSCDTNILIRTFTVGRGWLQFPVGGGIVADSVPEHEYDETWHKAEGLLRAL